MQNFCSFDLVFAQLGKQETIGAMETIGAILLLLDSCDGMCVCVCVWGGVCNVCRPRS